MFCSFSGGNTKSYCCFPILKSFIWPYAIFGVTCVYMHYAFVEKSGRPLVLSTTFYFYVHYHCHASCTWCFFLSFTIRQIKMPSGFRTLAKYTEGNLLCGIDDSSQHLRSCLLNVLSVKQHNTSDEKCLAQQHNWPL